MSLAKIFDELGSEIIPEIFGQVLPDAMNIVGENKTQGAGGGQIKSANPNIYENVPVTYEPVGMYSRDQSAGARAVSLSDYVLTFPTHHNGARMNIDVKNQRLKVLARGNEPEKVFRILALRDLQGVSFEAVCVKEN